MKTIRPGQVAYWKGQAFIVLELKGLAEAIVRGFENGKTDIVPASELSFSPEDDSGESKARHVFAKEKDWDKAMERYRLIQPLLNNPARTKSDVERVARESDKNPATIYRWLKKVEETGLASSLLRVKREDKGKTRLDPEVEAVITQKLQDYYLKKERPTPIQVYRQIKLECIDLDLSPPNKNTIYSRIRSLDDHEKMRQRYSPRAAKQKYQPLRGQFPGADYPNAVVQIDHTKVDVMVVDEEHRKPIGRPYLTISIDVATKMISGFQMTLDPPGASSAGLCIAHAISRKEHWLAKRDIAAEWPIYGKMQKIHLDNAKEFRGLMLQRACGKHGIIIENRPKGQPNYGPHVERAFRTYMQECQSLPGSTFSSVAQKADYDSEGRACMTLRELELWFTVFIVYCYHHRPHKGINSFAPIKKYYQYVHGDAQTLGVGLPAAVEDEWTLRLDFTPYVERTIQRNGVVIDHIHYYSDRLRPWIAAKEKDSGKTKKFVFARDPRDVSAIYFLNPETELYESIPCLNNARPSVSLWELRESIKQLSETEFSEINEEMIFSGIRKMREIEQEAIEKTRLAKSQRTNEKRRRRMAERRKGWQNIHPEQESPSVTALEIEDDDDISPFSDIDIG